MSCANCCARVRHALPSRLPASTSARAPPRRTAASRQPARYVKRTWKAEFGLRGDGAGRARGCGAARIWIDSCAANHLIWCSRNAQVRLSMEEHMGKQADWKLFKNSWILPKPVLPGVWQRKEGGHVVRARVTESTTGKQKEI